MMAGNAMPTDDKQNAPINEIRCSKFGMAMAKKTENTKVLYITIESQQSVLYNIDQFQIYWTSLILVDTILKFL